METLKEINARAEIRFNGLAEDWRVMRDIVGWCDSYTRHGRVSFNILKDFNNYMFILESDMSLPNYIRRITLFSRFSELDKPLEFIKTKFKRFLPEVVKE